jgi:hypothetical protein
VSIPFRTEVLTPDWFGEVLGSPVTGVEVLDAHSGTTGRARVRLTGASDLPATVFVKLQPFTEEPAIKSSCRPSAKVALTYPRPVLVLGLLP